MNTKLLGSILLIIGTSIGGGMLALPIATSPEGFWQSAFLLLGCWVVMTASAFLILEVNLWLPPESNMISMAKATLGKSGQVIAWTTYLLLLYSLLAAYIAGGGDFLRNLLTVIHITSPAWLTSLLFAGLLGYVVCLGIQSVDVLNRTLMFFKLSAFVLLISFIMPHVSSNKLNDGEFHFLTASITVAITSFGFATIIPSLRTYFADDVKKLRCAILVGSLIPLICYILWNIAIMGVIPQEGLIKMFHSNRSTTEFVTELSTLLQRNTITEFARAFTSVCLITSFLGVALGLVDFLADGLKLSKKGKNIWIIYFVAFVPPLLCVLIDPGIFVAALSYAGIYCVILLILLPALMAWSGRYRKNLSANSYQVRGGKVLLIGLIVIALGIMGQSLLSLI